MPTPIRKGSTALIEQPNSPEWSFGEQVRAVRTFYAADYALALSSAPMRGAIGTGIVSGYRVSESQVKRIRGGMGQLTISYENAPGSVPGQGSQLPADEAEIVFEKLEHPIEKLPRYDAVDVQTRQYIDTLLTTKYDDPSVPPAQDKVFGNALNYELFVKLQRKENYKVLYVPVYRLLVHSWTPPLDLSKGGFLENPPNFPIVAPAGFEWLREGDRISFNDSFWIVERRWLASERWDRDLYS